MWELKYLLSKLTVGEVMTHFVVTTAPERLVHDEAIGRVLQVQDRGAAGGREAPGGRLAHPDQPLTSFSPGRGRPAVQRRRTLRTRYWTEKESPATYDLHADLLFWLEQARQDELQRKVALQALLCQAQMDSPMDPRTETMGQEAIVVS